MRILRTLLWKEWRDHRALLAISVSLMIALVLGGELLYGPAFDADLRGNRFLPVVWLLFLTVLSADVATRDHGTGAAETLGRLPLVQRLVWGSRALFVLACGVLSFGLLAALEGLVRAGEGVPADAPAVTGPVLLAAALVVAGVLGAGGLLRRPLPAALIGLAVPFGLPLGIRFLPEAPAADWLRIALASIGFGPAELALVLAGALALAAVCGHTPWRARRGAERAWVAAGLALVLAPTGLLAARGADRRTDQTPHAAGIAIHRAIPSPDGRFVALETYRDLPSIREWTVERRDLYRCEVWLLDRSSGEVATIDERPRTLSTPIRYRWDESPWGADGSLHTRSCPGPSLHGGEGTLEVIDPVTARVVQRWPAEDHQGFEQERGLEPWYERERHGERRVVRWRGRELSFELEGHDVIPTPLPGRVLFAREGRLVHRDLSSGLERELTSAGERWSMHQSRDGRHLAVRDRSEPGYRILDVATGEQLAGGTGWPHWCTGADHVLIWNGQLLRRDGTWHDLPLGRWYGAFDDRHALRYGQGEARWREILELVDLESGEVTHLYGPR